MEKLVCILVLLAVNAAIATVVAFKNKNSLKETITLKESNK